MSMKGWERGIWACVLVLAACNGDGGDDDPTTCANGMPNGAVDVTVSGGVDLSASFDIPCGTPDSPYGATGQHLSPTEGDPKILVLILSEGADDWRVSVGADLDEVTPGTVPVMLDGSPNFGIFGHGVFNMPVGIDGDLYLATGGTVTIDEVDELTVGSLGFVVVSGSFEADFEHEDTAAAVTVEADFTRLAAMTDAAS